MAVCIFSLTIFECSPSYTTQPLFLFLYHLKHIWRTVSMQSQTSERIESQIDFSGMCVCVTLFMLLTFSLSFYSLKKVPFGDGAQKQKH